MYKIDKFGCFGFGRVVIGILGVCLLLLAAGRAQGQENVWLARGTGYWDDASIWRLNTGSWEDVGYGPTNDPLAKINTESTYTVTLTNSATIRYLAMNSGTTATDLVIDGGSLHSDGDGDGVWNAIGYNQTAGILITNGGSWICDGRIDVGLLDTGPNSDGMECLFTMEEDSGDVTVSNSFALGFDLQDAAKSATCTARINGGTLTVGGTLYINKNGTADDTCVMDIAGGKVIVSGDITGDVATWVGDGRLTAHGGDPGYEIAATYDGNGKTTIQAIPYLVSAAGSPSAFATIHPNAAGDAWVAHVSWTDASPPTPFGNAGSDLDDPSVQGNNTYILPGGPAAGAEVRYGDTTPESNSTVAVEWTDPLVDTLGVTNPPSVARKWDDVGDYIDFGNLTYGSGVAGVEALHGGPAGVYFDEDGGAGGILDDIGILLPGTVLPSAGSIIVTGPLPAGIPLNAIYKPGVYTNNPNIHLTVTMTPVSAVANVRSNAVGDAWVVYLSWIETNGLTACGSDVSTLDDPAVRGNSTYALPSGPAAGAVVRYGDVTPEPNSGVAVEWTDPLVDTIGVTNPPSVARMWEDVGEFIYLPDLAYGSGVAGVQATDGGPAGVCFSYNGDWQNPSATIGFMRPGTNPPTTGGFIITAPLPANTVFTDTFYPGTYTDNPRVLLNVLGPDVPRPRLRPTGFTILVR